MRKDKFLKINQNKKEGKLKALTTTTKKWVFQRKLGVKTGYKRLQPEEYLSREVGCS